MRKHDPKFLLCCTALILPCVILPATEIYAATVPAGAQACAACHGPTGAGGGIFPRIAGLPAAYLANQLRLFRDDVRQNSMMQPMAQGLSNAEIDALADYFSELHSSHATTTGELSTAERTRGQQLVTVGDWPQRVPACVDCHGPSLAGGAPEIPALTGQSSHYLASRLEYFRSADATHPFPAMIMSHVAKGLSDADMQAVVAYIAQIKQGEVIVRQRPVHDATWKFTTQSPDKFTPPPERAIPVRENGEAVWRGEQLFMHTQKYAAKYVGNTLSCVNCHLDRGRLADSAPMWAAYVLYPKYRSKNNKINTLAERIQGCFRFSMNGKAPAADSAVITELSTYFYWLASGLPTGITSAGQGYPALHAPRSAPDRVQGQGIYATQCALCHGGDGAGRYARDETIFPPLWGKQSFNWGAGMHRISTAAAFIHANMPYGAAGTLSEQQAWDVAAFMVSHDRPQDPRFTGNVAETRAKFHAKDSYYGRSVDGHVLGSPPH